MYYLVLTLSYLFGKWDLIFRFFHKTTDSHLGFLEVSAEPAIEIMRYLTGVTASRDHVNQT